MMRELDRGEMLDRLPEYVLGTLPEDERRAIDAALATDQEMVRELQVIQSARASLIATTPAVNVDRIVAGIKRPAPVRRTNFSRWRIAAAVATLAVGGASLSVVQNIYRGNPEPPTIVGETASVADEKLSVSFGYDLSDLSADDLEELVKDLKSSGGVPSAEPKSTVITTASEGLQ